MDKKLYSPKSKPAADADIDNIDRSFKDCLIEIQRTYATLSKSLRLRSEKWCEKLIATGSNRIWRKNRNDYAKMLLGMVDYIH